MIYLSALSLCKYFYVRFNFIICTSLTDYFAEQSQASMAGWLGSNFTAQLDQLKKGVNQVSSIVKDTLVVDDSWDQENGEVGEKILEDELTSNERQLLGRYQKLEKLYNVSQSMFSLAHRWRARLHVFILMKSRYKLMAVGTFVLPALS